MEGAGPLGDDKTAMIHFRVCVNVLGLKGGVSSRPVYIFAFVGFADAPLFDGEDKEMHKWGVIGHAV